jgi:putative ABC transport system permease protein
VLKAVGADARQVRRLVLFTAAFMATIAQVVGTIAGILLALILIFVVNRQSFGWTVQVHLDPILIVTSFGGILLVAVGAALWPAWSASRGSVRESLHFE